MSDARPLKQMFDAVPDRYDLLNRLLTLRLDERWRARAARRCLEARPRRVLDLCCGTGDLALRLARLGGPDLELTGLDYSAGMLEVARAKAARAGVPLILVEGDAADLQLADRSLDAVGIAFAFRNLTWRNPLRERALAEVHRVLTPGGRFVIVETSQPRSRLLRWGFHTYLRALVPLLGRVVAGRAGAYRYLAESARRFYTAGEVTDLLREAGFAEVTHEPLLGGAAAVHVATR